MENVSEWAGADLFDVGNLRAWRGHSILGFGGHFDRHCAGTAPNVSNLVLFTMRQCGVILLENLVQKGAFV